MTGLDHKRTGLNIREKFAVTKEKTKRMLEDLKDSGNISGCLILSTCNRTELYTSVPDGIYFSPSQKLCNALGLDLTEYQPYLTERTGPHVMEHLCRVASGLDSQITGDDQIITQVREALELSRGQNCTDSFLETMFNLSIHSAKVIKTNVLSGTPGASSVPEKTVEKLKTMCHLADKNALVIGSGKIGRLVAELLILENVRVTITLRSHKKGVFQIPDKAGAISYDERYRAVEKADIVISATTSPHLTLLYNEMSALKKRPKIIVDLAVPRDVEPSIKGLSGVILLTIDDISGETRFLPPESVSLIESVIGEHIAKYRQWVEFKENMSDATESTKQKPFFPLFIDMSGRKALIAGGGNVAERRIKVLLDFGADIIVISPEVSEYIEHAASLGTIRLLKQKYKEGDVTALTPFLVIAATSDRQVNHQIALEAKSLDIHVSAADCRRECTCFFPAIADNGSLIAGLVSKDGNHAGVKRMAKKIRETLNS
jgi:glutamyl-tRNA reductase